MSCVLAIDVGSVRVGVATSDETWVIATPLTPLAFRNQAQLHHDLLQLAEQRQAVLWLIGLPRHLDGTEGDAAASARDFGRRLAEVSPLPIEWWDERFTTVQAERILIDSGVRRAQRRQRIDSVAAALLLQSWLDSPRRRARP